MDLQEQILRSQQLVKQLSEGINHRTIDLKQGEQQVLDHVNRIGQMLVD